ncbi:unnamed protein product [Dicrocoelium dendriticum]|nr:unnamed protein product [Dicrocoelium dendriticum]
MISQGKLCANTTAQQPNEELHLGSVKAARLNNELRTTDVSMQTVTSSHSLDKTMDIKDEGTQTNGDTSQHGSLSAFGTPAHESAHVHRVNKRPPAQQRNVSDRAPARERPPFYPPGPRSCREVDYTSESTRLDRIRHARSLYRRSYYLSIPASGTTRYKSNPCLSQCPKRSKSMLNCSQNSSYTGSSGQSQNGGPISHEQAEELQRSVSLRTIPPLTQDTMPDKVPYWSTLCMDQSPEAETQQLSDSLEPMAPGTVQQSPRRSPEEKGLTSVPDFIHLAESGNSKGTYRLDVTSTESLKRDLLNLHVQADELDRRWRNTDEAPESKKLNIFTSTARWTWPVRQRKDQFVSEKSFKLAFPPLKCTTRSVSAVSTSREILVPLNSTHPVHAAMLRSTGPGQSLSIMQARIVYDLTFRPLQMETSMDFPGGDEVSTASSELPV